MLVYDKDGRVHDKPPPDVRECVDVLGWSLTPTPDKEPEKLGPQSKGKGKTS